MTGSDRRRGREWIARYLPLEVLGTVAALGGAWLAHALTGSLIVAAIAGTIAEGVGYYAIVVVRGIRSHLATQRVRRARSRWRRALLAAALELRSLMAEFGPAEMLDTVVVRPALMFAVPSAWGGHPAAWLVGKLLADVVFYVVTIASFELGRRIILPVETDAAAALVATATVDVDADANAAAEAAAPARTPVPRVAVRRAPILEGAVR